MSNWQPIETAPKGGGAEMVTDPAWIDPPIILLLCAEGRFVVAHWDWYYADGGRGCTNGIAWIEAMSGEKVSDHYGAPTHWQPLPEPPK